MNAPAARRRGQPLLALGLILGGWIGLRAVTWQPVAVPVLAVAAEDAAGAPLALPTVRPIPPAAMTVEPRPALTRQPARRLAAWPVLASPVAPPSAVTLAPAPAPVALAPAPVALAPAASLAAPSLPAMAASPLPAAAVPPVRRVAHALLWMAAVADLPLPPAMLAPRSAPLPRALPRESRWSGDGWLLVRPDGGTAGFAAGLPTYGASQAGAVLRYRLAGGARRPAAYLRATAALESGERGVAFGLSARPLPALPLRLMAEARADRFVDGGTHARAAAFAVTELAPVTLPARVRAEFYAQAGYVTGPAATGFVDGQLRLDRVIAGGSEHGELRAGAGAWGGVQRGTSRLDIGPTATIAVATGAASARLAFDWRFRVAGNAAPTSGPALTISAGF